MNKKHNIMNYRELRKRTEDVCDSAMDCGLPSLGFCQYDDLKHVLIFSYMTGDTFGSRVVIKYKNL